MDGAEVRVRRGLVDGLSEFAQPSLHDGYANLSPFLGMGMRVYARAGRRVRAMLPLASRARLDLAAIGGCCACLGGCCQTCVAAFCC